MPISTQDSKLQKEHNSTGFISGLWTTMDADKSAIFSKCEKYARWTLPSILSTDTIRPDKNEHKHDFQSIGARSVNHLANKLAFTLFNPARPFFRLEATPAYLAKLEGKGLTEIVVQEAFAKVERVAMRRFLKWRSRTAAIFALKSAIIVGNSLMYFPDGGKAQTFNFRDFVVTRDLSGKVIQLITRDRKKIATLEESLKRVVLSNPNKTRKPEEDCDLFTSVVWKAETQKYHVFQAVDDFPISTVNGTYHEQELPWIALTWDLQRGADYGTGLVEEYSGDFHALSTLTTSMVIGATLAADIKFLVDPGGNTDYKLLNGSASGSYLPGRKEDIHTFSLDKVNDFSFVDGMIKQYEKRIGLAFLLGSAVTREAERVTAEEIRFQAQELETGLGGQYSRLAEEFQVPMSYLLLKDADFSIKGEQVEPIIITGLESLSRNSEVDKLLLYFQDLAIIASLPEEVRKRLKITEVMSIFGTARSVDYAKFTKSEDDVAKEDAAMQANMMEAQNQAGQDAARNKAAEVQMSKA